MSIDNTNFVSLHSHTEHSLRDGVASPEDYAAYLDEMGMEICAITDHGSLTGLLPFDAALRKAGKHPLLGCELYQTVGPVTREGDCKPIRDNLHLTLLCRNERGVKNLYALVARAHTEAFYYDPRVTFEMLEEHRDGLFLLSGCIGSVVNSAILAATWPDGPPDEKGNPTGLGARARKKLPVSFGELDKALMYLCRYHEIFGPYFAVELMDHGMPEEEHCTKYLIAWARQQGIPIVGTNDVHYLREEDYLIQRVVTAGSRSGGDEDGGIGHAGLHLKSHAEMLRLPVFAEHPEALTNTMMVAEQCIFDLPKPTDVLPNFPLPPRYTNVEQYLWEQVVAGCTRRYGHFKGQVRDRATYEFGVVKEMGFLDYFAVVSDFMRWAKGQGVKCGPGRGSAAGALLAYALDITDVDPLRFGLLFERFLNPGRISMPDIDLDFADDQRALVVDYVKQKYGHDRVAQIATFSTLATRASIKAAARGTDFPFDQANRFSALFPLGAHAPSMDESLDGERIRNYLAALTPADQLRHRELVETARTVHGRTNAVGRHPAGIVIASRPLVEVVPVQQIKSEMAVAVDGEMAEKLGFLKMDFLGLKTLRIIRMTEEMIAPVTVPSPDDPMDDPAVYTMLREGRVLGVFQIEGKTATPCTLAIKPTEFRDLVAVNALGRPGPMDLVPSYVARKEGREEPDPPHECLRKTLEGTYGIMVYQEDAMNVARVFAGYSMSEADDLRKIIGKKKREEFAAARVKFVAGGVAQGHTEKEGGALFDLIEKFGDYAFNLSHATAYAMVGYWTAWLSCHHPREFFASLLTIESGDGDKVGAIIHEARRRGIPVLAPHIDHSRAECTVEGGSIRLGLGMLKGVGEKLAKSIASHQPYVRLDDPLTRVPRMDTTALKALIGVGGCDHLLPGGDPRQRVSVIAQIDDLATKTRAARARKTGPRWSIDGPMAHPIAIGRPATTVDLMIVERPYLGCYREASPLGEYARRQGRGFDLSEMPETEDETGDFSESWWEEPRRIVGEVRDIFHTTTKKDQKPMAVGKIGDVDGTVRPFSIFPRLYADNPSCAEVVVGTIIDGVALPNGYQGTMGLAFERLRLISLNEIAEMLETEDMRAREVLHVAFSVRQFSLPFYRKYLDDLLDLPEMAGERAVYLHLPDGAIQRHPLGVSSPRAAVERLQGMFAHRSAAGDVDLRWSGSGWDYPTETSHIEEENTHVAAD